jgi:outer membrane biogenesis lipoprotein LolB
MKLLAPLILTLLLCGCSEPARVSPAEFKNQYAWVGQAQTMHDVTYLGQRDGRAYIKISSRSTVSRKWSDRVIYVELAKLDVAFRDSLPKTEMKDIR